MNTTTPATILIVPGLREHVADHWQTLLAARLPRVRTVPPLEHDKLSCMARVDAIAQALQDIDGPVVLVAHSAGAIMVVHWAQSHRADRIRGALLATPADLETPLPAGYPTLDALNDNGWLPIPRAPLPFPSIVAASSNDPLAQLERARGLAQSWGSRLVELGAVGHLNPQAGFGDWPRADALVRELS
ncbi:putative alpha/beta hydrolase family esterase [Variovorax paradoxus]|uniref:Alpha/beta hydrolase family esterase n=1 Tax=Variovorax paradoxus TaxID=34073 RepID=A0AAW8EU48_VARPD|nr:alpha/beta fold hydrolase [Variovorax paradoxus]MDP9975336.1 putative alpha/beta hydrolase family esterase [Variovorax paradoxus]